MSKKNKSTIDQKTGSSEQIENSQELIDDIENDEVIGRALKGSLLILCSVAMIAVIIWMSRQKSSIDNVVSTNTKIDTPVSQAKEMVSPPEVSFTDITKSSGVHFKHFNGAYGEKLLPETMGGGVAFFDYDNDGDADLFFVNGTSWPDHKLANEPETSLSLYSNDGDGNFTDVSSKVGLNQKLYGMGVAVADFDADGDVDIFVSAVGENLLLENRGGQFVDITRLAGVSGSSEEWSTSAAFFDADNDGDLDLFVANYVKWNKDIDLEVDYRLTGIGRAFGPPSNFEGQHSRLYLNEGNGAFKDYSLASGIQVNNPATGNAIGKSLAVLPADIDEDGLIDLVVANDTVQNFVFHNLGDGKFEEVGALWGMAFDRNGHATGAMGIDLGWYRNDSSKGFAVGNFANEMTSFYVANDGSTYFSDQSIIDGLGPASRSRLSFGLFFFDYDLDGNLDLFQANGHVENEINKVQKSQSYKQALQLFWNCGIRCGASFIEVKPHNDNSLNSKIVGRGAAYADIDNDGDLDIVVTQINGAPLLLRNQQQTNHQWLKLKLHQPGENPDAIGAIVELVYQGGKNPKRLIMPTRSYLSQVMPIAHFGIADESELMNIVVTWPDGYRQTIEEIGRLNRLVKVVRK